VFIWSTYYRFIIFCIKTQTRYCLVLFRYTFFKNCLWIFLTFFWNYITNTIVCNRFTTINFNQVFVLVSISFFRTNTFMINWFTFRFIFFIILIWTNTFMINGFTSICVFFRPWITYTFMFYLYTCFCNLTTTIMLFCKTFFSIPWITYTIMFNRFTYLIFPKQLFFFCIRPRFDDYFMNTNTFLSFKVSLQIFMVFHIY